MRAAYLAAPGRLAVGEFEVPCPRDGELLVHMRHAAVCGSDAHIVYDGFHNPDAVGKPGYPGHEGVGVVVRGRSDRLTSGCPVLTVPPGHAGGCFAEYQVLDERHLVELPVDGDPRRLVLAQQLGTAIYAARRFCRPGGGTAAIIGAGPAGLFLLQLLRARGYREVVVSDPHPDRLALAERFGGRSVPATTESIVDAVLRVTGGAGADLVIEAAGYDACRADAVDAVAVNGTVGCFGYPERTGLADFPVRAAFRKSVTVSWVSGTQSEPGLRSFREAVALIHRGAVEVDFCLDFSVSLPEVPAGVATARQQGAVLKVTVDLPREVER